MAAASNGSEEADDAGRDIEQRRAAATAANLPQSLTLKAATISVDARHDHHDADDQIAETVAITTLPSAITPAIMKMMPRATIQPHLARSALQAFAEAVGGRSCCWSWTCVSFSLRNGRVRRIHPPRWHVSLTAYGTIGA